MKTIVPNSQLLMVHTGDLNWNDANSGVGSTAVCYHNCEKRSYTMNIFIWSRAIKFGR